MADDKPIVVVKKKGGHGGHHGGAWKVAYADFVTAMMAFFMVMWLVNSASEPTRQSIASYFRKPGLFENGSGTPLEIGGAGFLTDAAPPKPEEKKKGSGLSNERMKKKSGSDDDDNIKRLTLRGGTGAATGIAEGHKSQGFNIEEPEDTPPSTADIERPQSGTGAGSGTSQALQALAEQIRQEIAGSPELQELIGVVDVKADSDGLNIEIMDTEKTSMFASGSDEIRPEAKKAFQKLTDIIVKLPNSVDIVGHTDAKPFPRGFAGGYYSNWELSADRANAARRLLISEGLDATRITSVMGRADRELKVEENPNAAANRRITLKMRFNKPETVDLGKNPGALTNFGQREKQFYDDRTKAEQDRLKKLTPKVHTLTPKEIIENKGQRSKKPIRLTEEGATEKPTSKKTDPRDKKYIFGDSPVFGRSDPFNDF